MLNPNIKTLEDARKFLLYVAYELFEELVGDSCPGIFLSVSDAMDALVSEGVVTQDVADEYKKLCTRNSPIFDWAFQDEMCVLTGHTVADGDEYGTYAENVMACIYGAIYLHDKSFRALLLDNVEEFLEDHDMELDDADWQAWKPQDVPLPFDV